jgi:hypothetical protein
MIVFGAEVCYVKQIFVDVTVLWDTGSCSPCVKSRFGGMYHLHLQSRKLEHETVA